MKNLLKTLTEQPEEDYSELLFGHRLKAIREARGLSQKDLSNKIGVTPNYVSNYERNINMPNIQTLEWICKALCVSATDLLGF